MRAALLGIHQHYECRCEEHASLVQGLHAGCIQPETPLSGSAGPVLRARVRQHVDMSFSV